MKRYRIRFYRAKDEPEAPDRWFEHDILAESEEDMIWKVQSIIKFNESQGGHVERTKVILIRDEPSDGNRDEPVTFFVTYRNRGADHDSHFRCQTMEFALDHLSRNNRFTEIEFVKIYRRGGHGLG